MESKENEISLERVLGDLMEERLHPLNDLGREDDDNEEHKYDGQNSQNP